MQISIRRFLEEDIPDKVRWINDPANNRYLHYDLPLTEAGTERWFRRIKDADDRLDCVITAEGVPCGLIGLLHIDPEHKTAEFYITVGEPALKREGVAFAASELLLERAFSSYGLSSVYLFTEPDNLPARRLFTKLGFEKDPCLREGVYPGGRPACRFVRNGSHPDQKAE